MLSNPGLFWQLRLAAAEIVEDERRQRFLNALAETVAMMAGGETTPPPSAWDESIAILYEIPPSANAR